MGSHTINSGAEGRDVFFLKRVLKVFSMWVPAECRVTRQGFIKKFGGEELLIFHEIVLILLK